MNHLEALILVYFLLMQAMNAWMIALSTFELGRARGRRWPELDSILLSQERTPPIAIIAPEFPALTTASTSPRRISSNATAIDESFLRKAALGDSCIVTSWEEPTIFKFGAV